MREGIGNIWITGLVITFMLIFSGYLAVTISYSTAIKNKNYIIDIIEKKNGITSFDGVPKKSTIQDGNPNVYTDFGTLETINLFLRGSSYRQKGSCGLGKGDAVRNANVVWYGVKDLYSDTQAISLGGGRAKVNVAFEEVQPRTLYYYCFTKIRVKDDGVRAGNESVPLPAYYRIRLFYALDLPIVSSLVFTIDGKTNTIDKPSFCEINQFINNTIKNNCPRSGKKM